MPQPQAHPSPVKPPKARVYWQILANPRTPAAVETTPAEWETLRQLRKAQKHRRTGIKAHSPSGHDLPHDLPVNLPDDLPRHPPPKVRRHTPKVRHTAGRLTGQVAGHLPFFRPIRSSDGRAMKRRIFDLAP